ncbi:hypothetical protein K3163_04465 [Qipengyuania sp. 1NDW9]|uniref:hypothetical protein n=1 Tax=Qipengyuania xiapuensis TaxID=2867236 RepID=UPI001C8673E0|nr:hypothetical protein [Qipengyuania xiapuensis]MBX7492457.1 hypothetical protein [Qipengyuania xiapuensis]
MLWVFLIGLFLVVIVVRMLAKAKNAELEAEAAYNNIKRSDAHPELQDMSESEFKLGYLNAGKARRKAVVGLVVLAFMATMGIAYVFVKDSRDGETLAYALFFAPMAMAVAAGFIGNAFFPKISTIMKNQLKEASKRSSF